MWPRRSRARMSEAERLILSASHLDHVKAKELLDEFEARFPGAWRRCRPQAPGGDSGNCPEGLHASRRRKKPSAI